MLKQLPNLITIVRIVLVPIIGMYILKGQHLAAFITLMVAGASDGLDGFLARRMKARTLVGAYLDPLADKILVGVVYLTMAYVNLLPWWFVVIIICRDLLILAGIAFLRLHAITVSMNPTFLSKVNTTFQILLLLFVLLNELCSYYLYPFIFVALGVVLTTTILSAIQYVAWGIKLYGKET